MFWKLHFLYAPEIFILYSTVQCSSTIFYNELFCWPGHDEACFPAAQRHRCVRSSAQALQPHGLPVGQRCSEAGLRQITGSDGPLLTSTKLTGKFLHKSNLVKKWKSASISLRESGHNNLWALCYRREFHL